MAMEMSSPSPSPTKPDSPLADAFNLFVHSPDPSGRLRIDATKFMDAFLAKKAAKAMDSENKRPPPFQWRREPFVYHSVLLSYPSWAYEGWFAEHDFYENASSTSRPFELIVVVGWEQCGEMWPMPLQRLVFLPLSYRHWRILNLWLGVTLPNPSVPLTNLTGLKREPQITSSTRSVSVMSIGSAKGNYLCLLIKGYVWVCSEDGEHSKWVLVSLKVL